MSRLVAHDWPGNVRELENTLSRAVVLCRGPAITLEDLSITDELSEPAPASADRTLSEVERRHVQRVLADTQGNKSKAARILGISRPRLHRMAERWDLNWN